MQKISVITVVYNDVTHIKETINSFLQQTWPNKELIIIDGGSTDGTADIIRSYAPQLAFWCSEPDKGLYDAMNKGLQHSKGDWVNILNAGDYYASPTSLADMMQSKSATTADILYANSIQRKGNMSKCITADASPARLRYEPCYRHGSSLVRRELHLRYPFRIERQKEFRYALDWDVIYRLYRDGYTFIKVDTLLQSFDTDGESNHPYLSHWLNYKVRRRHHFDIPRLCFSLRRILSLALHDNPIYPWIRGFACELMVNDILPHLPWFLRRTYLRRLGCKIGKGSFIMKRNYMMHPWRITIGDHTHINRGCTLDARGEIHIADDVSISHGVGLFTGTHLPQSSTFEALFAPITIERHAWIGARATILQGTTIGEGAIVCAGAVVTHDVTPYTIVAGIPAEPIGKRTENLQYHCQGYAEFT